MNKVKDVIKAPDYINFDVPFYKYTKKQSLSNKFTVRQDKRTKYSTAKEVDCSLYQLEKNYINFLSDTVKWHTVNYKDIKVKCYTFLDFNAIPIILLPVGVLPNELALFNEMYMYAKEELKLTKVYKLPVIDFFTGIWRTSVNMNDAWCDRDELAEKLGLSPQSVHTMSFFDSYVEYINKRSIQ